MTTEVLGFLIIVGALIVFIVRRDLWNGMPNKADEVEEATVKMRLQMEHSGNEIITRMESQIRRLENLVTKADERSRVLEHQLTAARADQERAAIQAEQRFAALRAAQERAARDAYYMGGAPMGYAEPEAAWREIPYRSERRTMRPVDGVSPVRRMETRPRMIAPYGAGEEDFAETLSASMRAEQARYPDEYDVYARPETGQYYETAYDADYRDERVYAEPMREEAGRNMSRAAARRPAARVMDAETAGPAEMVAEETPAAVLDAQFVSERQTSYEEEPEEDEPFFSAEALEELAHIEPEIVVSPSVADVVDLPLDPEEDEEEPVYSARDTEQENGPEVRGGNAGTDYDGHGTGSETQSARLYTAEGGEPLRAEPIYDPPSEAGPASEMPAREEDSVPAEADTVMQGVLPFEQEDIWQEAEPIRRETDAQQTADEPFMGETDEGHPAEDDAREPGDAAVASEGAAPLVREDEEDALAPQEINCLSDPTGGDTIERAAAEESLPLPDAEDLQTEVSGYGRELSDVSDEEISGASFVRESEVLFEPAESAPPLDAEDDAHATAASYDVSAAAEAEPIAAAQEPDEAEPQAEPETSMREPSLAEREEAAPSADAAQEDASDWPGSFQTADAEAADMEFLSDEEPEEEISPVAGDASPAGRARELLERGMAPMDVARETGMGRGAVELLAQMRKGETNASA